jgi:hypothetical protein
MEMKVEVPFEQLLTLVKTLAQTQKIRLRKELNEDKPTEKRKDEFIEFLLNATFYKEKDITIIEDNRKIIAAWRTKS